MAETLDKYPLPLTIEERGNMREFLALERVLGRGDFHLGSFQVISKDEEVPRLNAIKLWASNLLRFDALHQRIKLGYKDGFVYVHNYDSNSNSQGFYARRGRFLDVAAVIDSGNVRVLDDSRRVKVGQSGMLLDPRPYLFNPSIDEPEQLDEILRETVLKGQRPPFFSNRPMARVGEEYRDSDLLRVDLGGVITDIYWIGTDDIVVLDNGQLIGRVIEYPFDEKKWS